jgi:threonine dehydrogenase-like Zn-dependent dehydrogenase
VNLLPMITHRYRLEDAAEVLENMKADNDKKIKIILEVN